MSLEIVLICNGNLHVKMELSMGAQPSLLNYDNGVACLSTGGWPIHEWRD